MFRYFLAFLLVLPAFAQKVDTHIPLSELESLKRKAISQQIELLELKLRPMRMDVMNLESEQKATIKLLRAFDDNILAERYLNPEEYGIDGNTNSIFKVDEPTPRP